LTDGRKGRPAHPLGKERASQKTLVLQGYKRGVRNRRQFRRQAIDGLIAMLPERIELTAACARLAPVGEPAATRQTVTGIFTHLLSNLAPIPNRTLEMNHPAQLGRKQDAAFEREKPVALQASVGIMVAVLLSAGIWAVVHTVWGLLSH
jgi:hypothetical protein